MLDKTLFCITMNPLNWQPITAAIGFFAGSSLIIVRSGRRSRAFKVIGYYLIGLALLLAAYVFTHWI